MATSQDFVNWVCGPELDPAFLQYLIIAEGVDILRFASGSVHQTIYFPEAKAFHICHPPLPEQKRIVAILDEAFAGIDQGVKNTERNLASARELFESELDRVFREGGEGWEERRFDELCTIKHGFAFKSEYFKDAGKYVLLTPGNFYEKGGYRDRGAKQKYYVGEIPSDYVLDAGDLLIAMTEQAAGLLGSPILVPEADRFLHNQRLGLVLAKPEVPWLNEFFFHAFNTRRVRSEIHRDASGVKVRHTSPIKVGRVKVSFPSALETQRQVVESLNAIHEVAEKLEVQYLDKLSVFRELKQSILQKAFAGELTADDADRELAEAGA